MKQYITPGGKELTLEYAPNTALIRIKFVGGGELPVNLSGLYTDERQAELAIINYLDKAKPKQKAA